MTVQRIKWVKRLGIALLLYTVIGFFVLPAILKWQLRKRLPSLTHRTAQIDSVRMNPFALSLTIRGLALNEPDGSKFASWSNLYVNFEALGSIANWAWTFQRIELDEPYGYVALLTNGQFNFANLLTNQSPTAAQTQPPKTNPPPRVLVHSLIVSNGMVEIADFHRAKPFQTKFTPIDVRLTEFTTRPATDTPYSFIASTGEGERFAWRGDFTVVPLTSHGRFEFGGIDLKKYSSYGADFTQFEVQSGKLNMAATYQFSFDANSLEASVTNASVGLTNLQVRVPDTGDDVLQVPFLAVLGMDADMGKRTVHVQSIKSSDAQITARRFKSGELQVLALAKPAATSLKASTTHALAKTNAHWSLLVDTFTVSNYTVKIEDDQPATPARLLVDQISFAITNISNASNAPLGVQFAARLNEGGAVRLNGTATVLPPLRADLELDVSEVELRPFQPYLSERAKLAVTAGRVTTRGEARVTMEGTNAPRVNFVGDVSVSDFASIDQIVFQDFAKWRQVAVRGLDVSLNPLVFKADQLSCDQLVTGVVIGTNGRPTFAMMVPTSTNAAVPINDVVALKPRPKSEPMNVQIGTLSFTNASLRLADFSIQPPCRFAVQEFNGTVRGLSSVAGSIADVDLHGRVDENAPFAITGRVNPLASDMFIDLVISNRNMELSAFTPYMEKFAGYPLKKGKLSVALRYDLKQRELKAQHVMVIDHLTLGQKNNSPDATTLPVKLGVALLKDRNGKIELNVPIKGRLDDPKFKMGPLVWQVVMNVLAKAATSPFALLGALVGGGEELSFIEFAPGQAELLPNESAKIDKLSRALYDRPALELEIAGSADAVLDGAALGWLKLERELKSARRAELAGKSDAPATLEDVRFEPRDYARVLKTYYKQTFERTRPLPADVSAPGASTTNVATSAPAPRAEIQTKGAGSLKAREGNLALQKLASAVAAAIDPRLATRPARLPALDADDEVLAQMESELHARMTVGETELQALMNDRAQSVQRALLQTQKVEGERLFILAPKPAEAASKGQSRVNLSLN